MTYSQDDYFVDIREKQEKQARYEKQELCRIEGRRCSNCEEDCNYRKGK
jgi:hypothetical protein